MTAHDLNSRYECYEEIVSDLFERIFIPVDNRRKNHSNNSTHIYLNIFLQQK
jgi:hypothetical protein